VTPTHMFAADPFSNKCFCKCFQVVDELKKRNVQCVRIEKRDTNPRRFFKVDNDPTLHLGLSTLFALGF